MKRDRVLFYLLNHKISPFCSQKYHMYTVSNQRRQDCIFHWQATQFMNLILYFPELGYSSILNFWQKCADFSIRPFSFVLNSTYRQHDLCYVISCQQEKNVQRIKITLWNLLDVIYDPVYWLEHVPMKWYFVWFNKIDLNIFFWILE